MVVSRHLSLCKRISLKGLLSKISHILYGTSNIDPWTPLQRAEESRDVLTLRGAVLDFRVYEDMDHIINDDEIAALRDLIQA